MFFPISPAAIFYLRTVQYYGVKQNKHTQERTQSKTVQIISKSTILFLSVIAKIEYLLVQDALLTK